jgi:hypothetical protein
MSSEAISNLKKLTPRIEIKKDSDLPEGESKNQKQCAKVIMITPKLVYFASFDIGKENFAIYVESIPLAKLKNLHKWKKLRDIWECGSRVLLRNERITGASNRETYENLILFMKRNKAVFDKCIHFVIEKQLGENTMAVCIAQTLYTYILLTYVWPNRENVFLTEIMSSAKTRVLQAPTGMTKYKRKKWSVEKAYEILRDRDDEETIDLLDTFSKKDDMCDAINQLQAYKKSIIKKYKD